MVSIDGLTPSAYSSADGAPTLKALAARGAWASSVEGVWPTNTRPSHTSLLTGVPPAMHGIVDNERLDAVATDPTTFNWFATDIRVATLVSAASQARLRTAAVMWPVSVGMQATYLVPTFNWRRPEDLELLRALSTPALLDAFSRETGKGLTWPITDEQKVELATYLWRAKRPDLLLLYIGTLDAFAHTYGDADPMTRSALSDIDRLVARLLSIVERDPNTYVVIVSDHGFIDVSHATGPNTRFVSEGLIRLDGSSSIARWDAISRGTGGSSLIYLREPSNPALIQRVGNTLRTLAGEAQAGIARIVSRKELTTAGADPAASFGIEMRPGYSLIEDTDRLFGDPYIKAMHGYPPSEPRMGASLLVAGPSLPRRGDLGRIRLTQIGPTVANLLGIRLSSRADSPIQGFTERVTRR